MGSIPVALVRMSIIKNNNWNFVSKFLILNLNLYYLFNIYFINKTSFYKFFDSIIFYKNYKLKFFKKLFLFSNIVLTKTRLCETRTPYFNNYFINNDIRVFYKYSILRVKKNILIKQCNFKFKKKKKLIDNSIIFLKKKNIFKYKNNINYFFNYKYNFNKNKSKFNFNKKKYTLINKISKKIKFNKFGLERSTEYKAKMFIDCLTKLLKISKNSKNFTNLTLVDKTSLKKKSLKYIIESFKLFSKLNSKKLKTIFRKYPTDKYLKKVILFTLKNFLKNLINKKSININNIYKEIYSILKKLLLKKRFFGKNKKIISIRKNNIKKNKLIFNLNYYMYFKDKRKYFYHKRSIIQNLYYKKNIVKKNIKNKVTSLCFFKNKSLNKIGNYVNSFINISSYKLFFNIILSYPFLLVNYCKHNNYINFFKNISKGWKKKVIIKEDDLIFESTEYYTKLGLFIEKQTNKNVCIFININNYGDISPFFQLMISVWVSRIKHFFRIFKKKFDLLLIMRLFFLVVKNKDIHLLFKIVTTIMPRIEFKLHRKFFKFLIRIFSSYMCLLYPIFKIQGFHFEFRGKISVDGNSRTRKMYSKIMRPSPSNYSYSTKYLYKTVNTFTGVLGLKVWIYYSI